MGSVPACSRQPLFSFHSNTSTPSHALLERTKSDPLVLCGAPESCHNLTAPAPEAQPSRTGDAGDSRGTMTDILHSARPPGAAEPPTYEAEPENEAEAPDCKGAGAGEDGSETAGPAERAGGRRKGAGAAFGTLSALAHFLAQKYQWRMLALSVGGVRLHVPRSPLRGFADAHALVAEPGRQIASRPPH